MTITGVDTKQFFENHPLPCWIIESKSSQIVIANKAAVKTFGFAQADWKKKNIQTFLQVSQGSLSKKAFKCAVETKSGKTISAKVHLNDIVLNRKKYRHVVLHEYSAKKELPDLQSLQKFQEAVLSSSIVTIANKQGEIIYVNKNFTDITGYTQEEAIGQNHRIVNSGYHSKSFWASMWKAISKGKPWRGEIRNKTKDGKYYWVDAFILPSIDGKGQVKEYLSIRNLITSKKQAEELLHQANERLSTTMNFAKVGSAELNIESSMVSVSPELLHMLGEDADHALEIPLKELIQRFIVPEDHSKAYNKIEEGLIQRKNFKTGDVILDVKMITKTGEIKLMEARGFFKGNMALGIFHDITEKRKTETEILKKSRQLENIIQTMTDGFCAFDTNWNFILFNSVMRRFKNTDLLGKNLWDEFPHLVDMPIYEKLHQAMSTGEPQHFEYVGFLEKGSIYEVNAYPNPDGMLVTFRNISERKSKEQELNKLALIARRTSNAVIITDEIGKITWVNEGFERTTGYKLQEALGKSPGQLLQGTDTDPQVIRHMRQAIAASKGFKAEVLNYTKSGKAYWVDVDTIPMRNDAGDVTGYIAIELDITQLKRAVSEMLKSQEQLQTIVNNIPMDVYIKDLRGRYIFYNRSFEKHFDGQHRLSGFTDFDLFGKDEAAEFTNSDRKILQTGETLTLEQDIIHEGKTDTYYTVKFPLKDINEKIYAIAGVGLPITERKQMEKALRESEERMRIAQEAANIGTWEWDIIEDKVFSHGDESLIQDVYNNREFITFNEFLTAIHDEDVSVVTDRINASLQEDKKYYAEFRVRRREGYTWILGSGSILRNDLGEPVRMIGIFMNITSRKEVEEKLKESHELLQEMNSRMLLATEAAHLGIWELSIPTNQSLWNEKMYEIFGITKKQHQNSFDGWLQTIHPEDKIMARAAVEDALVEGSNYHLEYRIIIPGRGVRYIVSYGKVQHNDEGKPLKMIGVARDNTEQKMFETQLKESEARYRSIVDHQIEMICRYNVHGDLTFVNRAYALTFGIDQTNLAGRNLLEFIPEKDHERMLSYFERIFKGQIIPSQVEQLTLVKGEWQWQEWFDLPLRDEEGRIYEIQSIGHDITHRKELEADQARLDKIVRESYNEIYLFHYHTLAFDFANASALKNLGYSAEELIRLRLPDIFTHPDEMALQALLNSLRNGDTDRLQLQLKHQRKDGSRYDVDVLIQVLERDISFVAIVSDITSKLITEKRLLDTIHEKETLIKEIHHRVKNNLQLISSIIYLKMASLSHSDIRTFLENTRQKIRSIALIHERLLQSEKLDKVEISDYLGKLIHDIQITYFRQDLEIEIKLEVQERIINLDTAIICGLIVNELVTNAIKHAFTGRANGTLEISFKQEEQTGKFLLKIADNGVSLPVNITPGISNSFGMQLLDVFVKQLGGTFEIIREKGTIFLIRF